MAKNAEQTSSPIDQAIDAVDADTATTDTATSYPGPNDGPAEIPEGGLHEDRSPGSPVGREQETDQVLSRLADILSQPAESSPLASLVIDLVNRIGQEQYKSAQSARLVDEWRKRRAFEVGQSASPAAGG